MEYGRFQWAEGARNTAGQVEFARMETREPELLAEKCTALTFELVGLYEEGDERRRTQSSGSGIFVAPCQALTAKHVVSDLHNVNPAWADEVRRRKGTGIGTCRNTRTDFRWSTSTRLDERTGGGDPGVADRRGGHCVAGACAG